MAETMALSWGRYGAESERLRLSAIPSSDRTGEFYWSAWLKIGDNLERRLGEGYSPTLLSAQLAAQAEALAWLGEAVAALGARVLTAEQVPLVLESLAIAAGHHWRLSDADGDVREQKSDAARNLTRELTGANHG